MYKIIIITALKALYIEGESPQPPPMRGIRLDDVMAAILRQNTHHIRASWWRGDRVMKSQLKGSSNRSFLVIVTFEK